MKVRGGRGPLVEVELRRPALREVDRVERGLPEGPVDVDLQGWRRHGDLQRHLDRWRGLDEGGDRPGPAERQVRARAREDARRAGRREIETRLADIGAGRQVEAERHPGRADGGAGVVVGDGRSQLVGSRGAGRDLQPEVDRGAEVVTGRHERSGRGTRHRRWRGGRRGCLAAARSRRAGDGRRHVHQGRRQEQNGGAHHQLDGADAPERPQGARRRGHAAPMVEGAHSGEDAEQARLGDHQATEVGADQGVEVPDLRDAAPEPAHGDHADANRGGPGEAPGGLRLAYVGRAPGRDEEPGEPAEPQTDRGHVDPLDPDVEERVGAGRGMAGGRVDEHGSRGADGDDPEPLASSGRPVGQDKHADARRNRRRGPHDDRAPDRRAQRRPEIHADVVQLRDDDDERAEGGHRPGDDEEADGWAAGRRRDEAAKQGQPEEQHEAHVQHETATDREWRRSC